MYHEHFGLQTSPFALSSDPDFLYLSKAHQQALSLLEYALRNQSGLCVLTGAVGAGKTTLLHRLSIDLAADMQFGRLLHVHAGMGELMPWVLNAFGMSADGMDKPTQYAVWDRYLQEQAEAGYQVVLLVDEAQNLVPEVIEELRLLLNANIGSEAMFQLVFSGQKQLREVLHRPELEQVLQRIAFGYHLKPFSLEDTGAYIQHRLQVAGAGEGQLFSDEAIMALHKASGGLPRSINILADSTLVYAYAEDKSRVDVACVKDVLHDREQTGFFIDQ